MSDDWRCMRACSPLGGLDVRVDRQGRIVGLRFGDDAHDAVVGGATMVGDGHVQVLVDRWFADGELAAGAIDWPQGSPFQKAVWRAAQTIVRGATCSYRELAASIGRPRAVRAVAAALAANPILLLVPCHRVLGSDGALRGYAGGLARKHRLLVIEGALSD
ncbi:MAG: methylated-DNA--[protein]-cysteine S-methyltransferase [Rhodocyclaceae bacterium]|nr:methylated-DNA--[protein]-cysteine S-methyltransferase [Rhodocyclaceae bacterium]